MDTTFDTLAIPYVAFWMWLTLRFVNRRERWAKRALSVIATLPILYVASFGPACWLTSRTVVLRDDEVYEATAVSAAYQPLLRLAFRGPHAIS